MVALNTEIVSKNSPAWIGFLHFIKSVIFIFVFGVVLQILGLSFDDLFGFYFATFWQTMRLLAISTFLGVGLAALLTRKNLVEANRVLISSTIWFMGAQLLILATLFWGDPTPHYGITSRDQYYDQLPLSIAMIIEFYFVSKYFFRTRVIGE